MMKLQSFIASPRVGDFAFLLENVTKLPQHHTHTDASAQILSNSSAVERVVPD